MSKLHAFFQEEALSDDAISTVACRLNKAMKHSLAHRPWPAYPYKPEVYFSIAYDATCLYLQYSVKEASLKAEHGRPNDPVYQDSCVEFFISFDDDTSYYNFEFNCIGTVLAAYGQGRNNRELLPSSVLEKIRYQAVITKENRESLVNWQLTLTIPYDAFVYHPVTSLRGKQCRANFYKCGDQLPQPHFLAWADIQSSEPDFHQPQYFGTVLFE